MVSLSGVILECLEGPQMVALLYAPRLQLPHEVAVPFSPIGRGGGLTTVALKLQQFQYNLNKHFPQRLRRLVFPMLLGPSDGPPPLVGEFQGGGASAYCLCPPPLARGGGGAPPPFQCIPGQGSLL